MPHMKTRLKKKMNDRHKRDRIERENLMLLNRLSHVMRTKQVDDTHDKAFTSDVHRKTLAIKRQFKWNRIAEENEVRAAVSCSWWLQTIDVCGAL